MLDIRIDGDNVPAAAAGAMGRSIATRKDDQGSNLPMIYVTRYCALEAASPAAAVRDALAALGAYAALHPEAKYGLPVVAYRNRRGTTVTLDIGLPLDRKPEASASGEFHLGEAPAALPPARRPRLLRPNAADRCRAFDCVRMAAALGPSRPRNAVQDHPLSLVPKRRHRRRPDAPYRLRRTSSRRTTGPGRPLRRALPRCRKRHDVRPETDVRLPKSLSHQQCADPHRFRALGPDRGCAGHAPHLVDRYRADIAPRAEHARPSLDRGRHHRPDHEAVLPRRMSRLAATAARGALRGRNRNPCLPDDEHLRGTPPNGDDLAALERRLQTDFRSGA